MKSQENNSDIKLNDSIEMEKFNQEKLKNFILQRDSRPSDPENPELFKPTVGAFKEGNASFEHDEKMKQGIKNKIRFKRMKIKQTKKIK